MEEINLEIEKFYSLHKQGEEIDKITIAQDVWYRLRIEIADMLLNYDINATHPKYYRGIALEINELAPLGAIIIHTK